MSLLHILIWILSKFVNVFYIPLFLIRPFQKHKSIPDIDNEILMENAANLAEKIRHRQLTSEFVVNTYIRRIKEVNPVINAVIDDRFPEAIIEAQKADQLINSGEFTIEEMQKNYPLLGVPLTVKGSIAVAGLRNSAGTVFRVTPESKDAVTVQRLRAAGVIPLLTSNTPELCLNWETSNKLVGTSNNPYNTTRTTGGSSGGEAALLASAASVIGIGSDIAGSLRLPSHCCGIYGHKPTPGVVSSVGHYPSCTDEEVWRHFFTLGPMSRYASDLRVLLSVMSVPECRKQLQLDERVNVHDLKIYFIEDINTCLGDKLNCEVRQALHDVISDLNEICTTKCKKVKFPLLKYATDIANIRLSQIDNVDNLFTGQGEGAFAELFRYYTCRSQSVLMAILYGVGRRLTCLLPTSILTANLKHIENLQQQFSSLLDDNSVLILPTLPHEALYHLDTIRKIHNFASMSIFNVLGLPVTNCPVKIGNSGLPIGMQIVTAPYCDRLAFGVAEELERIRGGWTPTSIKTDLIKVV